MAPPVYGGYTDAMATHRAFTVEAANELIPWVESVFERLDGHRQRWQRHSEAAQILEAMWADRIESPDNPDHDEFLQHRRGMADAARTIQGIAEQDLMTRGVRLPSGGLESGIVDFPTTFDGRWVYLCWQRGEPRLTHWHELETGFRGRRELTDDQAVVMGKDDVLPDDAGLDF
ncbi:MAG TPA: DUF2203 domain-containing protein [Candidatus Latescibacteria bacterium]|nr:DUF2203 domain-containing protein [Candidatus Latescibacterota bacterium]HJP29973.1 DUF2203 domain-containing protein [Candidatus Latescibacterota bacterium]